VAGFPKCRVVVFGDMVLDEFLYGRIDRVSREAPVLILEYEGVDRVPGGGGNAAANAAALGGTVLPVGCLGDDDSGAALREWYRRRGIDGSGILEEPSRTTPTKTRVLAGSSTSVQQQVVRIDRNVGDCLPEAVHRRLAERLQERVGSADALLISDYGHGTISEAMLQGFGDLAARPGLVTLVDSRRRLERFRGMTAVTPNLEEASGALGRNVPDEEDAVAEAARELQQRLSTRHLAITRGSRGMTVLGPGTPPTHLPVFGTDQVADVTGAGDTVIAAFSLALASGANTVEAAHLANVAAGLAVLKRGTATVSRDELLQALERGNHGD
jgi:rfaE bifunctional protein kinase chain/domain